jgi:3-oxoadipate enol-lactonase
MHALVNGTSLYVEDTGGSGPVVAFCHGLLFSCRMYDAQVTALRDAFRCVAWDHRGQGRSAPAVGRSVSIETVTADAIALLDSLGVGAVHFVGLSMGGFVGLRVAARRPDLVRTLTLLDTSADAEPEANVSRYRLLSRVVVVTGVGPVMGRVMPILFGRSWLDDPRHLEARTQWRRRLADNRRDIVKAVRGVIERDSVREELGAIRCPVTVAVGDEDVATTPAKAVALAQGIAGATLVQFPRTGHMSAIESPDAVTRVIRETIARAP